MNRLIQVIQVFYQLAMKHVAAFFSPSVTVNVNSIIVSKMYRQ